MKTLVDFLPTIQIVLSILLVLGVIMQQSEESLGGSFGGSDSIDTVSKTRRGSEKFIFEATIIIAIAFILTSIALVIIK